MKSSVPLQKKLNLQKSTTEIYKSMNHLSPSHERYLNEKKHIAHNLRKLSQLNSKSLRQEQKSFRGSSLNTSGATAKYAADYSFKYVLRDMTYKWASWRKVMDLTYTNC